MSPSRLISIVFITITILSIGCARQSAVGDQSGDLTVELSFDPDPPVTGAGLMRLVVTDEDRRPIEGLKIQVKGDMTHAGMKPVLGTATPVGDGVYSLPFEWTMAGDWIIQVEAVLPDGSALHRSFKVRVMTELGGTPQ